jgi:hypothetical protein
MSGIRFYPKSLHVEWDLNGNPNNYEHRVCNPFPNEDVEFATVCCNNGAAGTCALGINVASQFDDFPPFQCQATSPGQYVCEGTQEFPDLLGPSEACPNSTNWTVITAFPLRFTAFAEKYQDGVLKEREEAECEINREDIVIDKEGNILWPTEYPCNTVSVKKKDLLPAWCTN